MAGLAEFRFPAREAEIFGVDEDGNQMSPDDQESALDLNQRAVEDYLNNTLPVVFISQASLGSGTINPDQLATGTAGSGKAPVSQGASAPAWTDIATQSELDTMSASLVAYIATSHPFGTSDIQRGTVAWTLGVTDTNTVTTVIFGTVFAATPVVTTTVLNAADLNLGVELRSVTSAQFIVRVFPTAGIAVGATSGTVHWHAVKA